MFDGGWPLALGHGFSYRVMISKPPVLEIRTPGGPQGARGGPEPRKTEFFEYSFGSPSGRNFISKFVFIFEAFFVRLDNADNADVPKTRVLSDS